MLNENAKKWVAALRSGEYKQDTGYLHTDRGYCCLGVACVLAVKEGVIPSPLTFDDNNRAKVRRYDGDKYSLTEKVRKWLGLRNNEGGITDNQGKTSLARYNDTGKSFSEIADIIETEPEGLFV